MIKTDLIGAYPRISAHTGLYHVTIWRIWRLCANLLCAVVQQTAFGQGFPEFFSHAWWICIRKWSYFSGALIDIHLHSSPCTIFQLRSVAPWYTCCSCEALMKVNTSQDDLVTTSQDDLITTCILQHRYRNIPALRTPSSSSVSFTCSFLSLAFKKNCKVERHIDWAHAWHTCADVRVSPTKQIST